MAIIKQHIKAGERSGDVIFPHRYNYVTQCAGEFYLTLSGLTEVPFVQAEHFDLYDIFNDMRITSTTGFIENHSNVDLDIEIVSSPYQVKKKYGSDVSGSVVGLVDDSIVGINQLFNGVKLVNDAPLPASQMTTLVDAITGQTQANVEQKVLLNVGQLQSIVDAVNNTIPSDELLTASAQVVTAQITVSDARHVSVTSLKDDDGNRADYTIDGNTVDGYTNFQAPLLPRKSKYNNMVIVPSDDKKLLVEVVK